MVVGVLLVFECQTTVANMVQVLEPLEVGDGDTTSVDEQVWYDEHFLLLQDLVGFWCGRSISTFGNDLNNRYNN